MALKPSFDLELMVNNRRPFLPGNWQVADGGTWKQFEGGQATAVRAIRHGGRRYWITATVRPVSGFANFMAYGSLACLASSTYADYEIHRVDPRSDEYTFRDSMNLGSLTTIDKVIAKSGWSN
jgi:hypothetical protein